MSAMFCLPPKAVDSFKAHLISGEIDPDKLAQMTSEERHDFLKSIVGEQNAKGVNSLFESKLLLKNQQQGYISWAKKVAGLTPTARRDLLTRIQKMDHILDPEEEKGFLKDLASTKLGVDVTQDEAKNIATLSQNMKSLENKADANFKFPTTEDRLAYGAAKNDLEKYVNDLKLNSRKIGIDQPVRKLGQTIKATPGFLKSSLSTLDNSFFGRQGLKTLLNIRTSHIWLKNFAKSFVDIGRVLNGGSALDVVKADIFSRPHALSGEYHAGGYGLDALTEEAYPSTAPAKIPLFGRLFRASEEAYNAAALRTRADLADKFIPIAKKQGINTFDPKEARPLGNLVSTMTGRGNIGKLGAQGGAINNLLFSVKFLKSNLDTLTAHRLGFGVEKGAARTFVRKEAAKNLAGIIGSVASILTIAHTLNPNSVETDPRSTNFGKIKVGEHWVDITGGMGAITTLAARLVPTEHNGQWGLWDKQSNGSYANLTEGGFGKQTGLDILNQFWEGKLSPAAGVVRDYLSGQNYNGQKPTPKNEVTGSITPLSIQNYQQLKDSSNADRLKLVIADGLGFSVSSGPQKTDWSQHPTSAQKAFQQKVDSKTFKQTNDEYNAKLQAAQQKLLSNSTYKALPDDQKTTVTTALKAKIQAEVFKEHGFKYKAPKPDKAASATKKSLLQSL